MAEPNRICEEGEEKKLKQRQSHTGSVKREERYEKKKTWALLKSKEKLIKIVSYAESLSLKPENDYLKGCLTNELRTPYIVK